MSEKTFEQVSRELKLQLNPKLNMKIINTVKKLPNEIYEYVLRNVQFEKAMDCCLTTSEIKKNFLVLVKEEASETQIAYENAHAYLKHPVYTNISVEQAEKFEEEAKILSAKWLENTST
jgi:hypothetical protein